MKNFAKEINAGKDLFCSLEKTFYAYLHDVSVLMRIGSFNYQATNSSMIFFSSRAQSFTDETSEIAEEAINKFTEISSNFMQRVEDNYEAVRKVYYPARSVKDIMS